MFSLLGENWQHHSACSNASSGIWAKEIATRKVIYERKQNVSASDRFRWAASDASEAYSPMSSFSFFF